jgi:hypothetical protein
VKSIEFSGLKLSRIGQLKKSLEPRGIQAKEVDYVLRFQIGNEHVDSTPFKVVSSYSQLPAEYQAERPYKRQNSRSTSEKVPGKIKEDSGKTESEEDTIERPNKVEKKE